MLTGKNDFGGVDMNNQVKPKHNFKFGDIIENHYASEDNPRRKGIFVKKNSKGLLEMTDGKGVFWLSAADNEKLVKIGCILSDTPPVPTIKPGDKVRHEIHGYGTAHGIFVLSKNVLVAFDTCQHALTVPAKGLEVVE